MQNNMWIKGLIIGILILVSVCSNLLCVVEIVKADTVQWDVSLFFTNQAGQNDYVIFGEATDANDGPPVDGNDILKPPAPMVPYIRAWFDDNLPIPYNELHGDYRSYPDTYKVWNLSVQWVPIDYASPTTITISWDSGLVGNSDYTAVDLCTSNGTLLQNMLIDSSYTFNSPALAPQYFTIICSVNTPLVLSSESPSDGSSDVQITHSTLSIQIEDPEGEPFQWSITTTPNIGNSSGVNETNGTKNCTIQNLAYATTYTWVVSAYDGIQWTNQTYRFTTIADPSPPTPPPPSTPPSSPQNIKPVADASAGEPYRGYVNSDITFDGSRSYDTDGLIVSWFWVFGDGANKSGEIVNYSYTSAGIFNVTLTVTDDAGATDTTVTTAVITIPNLPPTTPTITGPSNGKINNTYDFVIQASDPEEGMLQYAIDWGDETSMLTEEIPSGIDVRVNHTWASAGIYQINVAVRDEQMALAVASHRILINVEYVGDIGYLIDEDNDGTYEAFYCNSTEQKTSVELKVDGTYLIDSNGDGIWEYIYNPETQQVTIYSIQEETLTFSLLLIAGGLLVGIIVVILLLTLVFFRRKQTK